MNNGRTINEAYDRLVRHDNVDNYKESKKTGSLIGKTIKILWLKGENNYDGKIGVVRFVDDLGQLHGTWGGLAVIPEEDEFEIIDDLEEI